MSASRDASMISVVIPCYKHAPVLAACLRGLACQETDRSFEVIVVDSGPDSAVREIVRAFPGVDLVESRRRLLPGAARNLGAQRSVGNWIAFIDADCVPDGNWIAAISQALGDGVKAFGGPVLDLESLDPVAGADNALQFYELQAGRPNQPAAHLAGCNLVMERSTFEALGGFPADLTAGEDTILTRKAAARWPGEVRFANRVRVRHRGRQTLAACWRHQLQAGYQRARLGMDLPPLSRKLYRSRCFAALVSCRRYALMLLRCLQWNLIGLPRFLLLTPWICFALAAYATGIHQGARSWEVRDDG